MRSPYLPIIATVLLCLAGIISGLFLIMDFSLLSDLLDNSPNDTIENYSLVSPTTDLIVVIAFILATIFLLIMAVARSLRLRYAAVSIYSLFLIILPAAQVFYFMVTTASFG